MTKESLLRTSVFLSLFILLDPTAHFGAEKSTEHGDEWASCSPRKLPSRLTWSWVFPTLEFRRAYDALLVEGADQADLDYVRILHLAASDGEECIRKVLASLLAAAIRTSLALSPRRISSARAGA